MRSAVALLSVAACACIAAAQMPKPKVCHVVYVDRKAKRVGRQHVHG